MRCFAICSVGLLLGCGRIGFDDAHVAPPELPELEAIPAIALHDGSTCTLRADGDLWCWGANYAGELGVGDYEPRPVPVRIGDPGAWRRVTAGYDHTCAVGALGDLYCWGTNGGASELGVGDYDARLTPTRVPLPGRVVAVASCESTTQALTTSGTRWGWGDNRSAGTIGMGSDWGPVLLPVPAIGDRWATITTGVDRACGIDLDGALWCWGSGTIGTGDDAEHFTPLQILPGTRWLAVSAHYHTCAIRDDGALFCWGANGGALGDGGLTDALTPIAIAPGETWRALGTGLDVTCAIRSDGALWCTGDNSAGQLGVGDKLDRTTLTEVLPGSRWRSVDTSPFQGHTCGIQEDGEIYCWGAGSNGELGQGADLAGHLTPVRVAIPGS